MGDQTGLKGMGGQTGGGVLGDQPGLSGIARYLKAWEDRPGGGFWETSPGWEALPDTLRHRVRTL